MKEAQETKLRAVIAESPLLSPFLARWDQLSLPDVWLAAGAVAQTVWNHKFRYPSAHGINDIDIIYFDADNLSEDAETAHSVRIRAAFRDVPVWIDVKNQARVHCWYKEKFGYSIPPYTSIAKAIATFPTTATAIGLRPHDTGLDVCAPYGMSDLFGSVARPNRKQITREIYEKKLAKWKASWPDLTIIGWDE
ncbi:nucleotidyltransferase family protein [Gluconacetobacter tumulisoli]|uniref:Nucleotidyltransferase family protein n=1 Tax=Gluconacetobacter tumulisoli TaxID=1286189 RepID=A0A7W4PKU1_9PROT|nr:nucleotidyltransferase family protein [Gluconacetobacter tumulisoli]MBB2201415.1 nucleotidyltransferase family protein [Gluconacetobacter tumulisoli]